MTTTHKGAEHHQKAAEHHEHACSNRETLARTGSLPLLSTDPVGQATRRTKFCSEAGKPMATRYCAVFKNFSRSAI
jgi:hypothetical protein